MRYWTALAPRAHAYRARWSTWTARRANALRLTGRNKYRLLGPSQKVLFSNNTSTNSNVYNGENSKTGSVKVPVQFFGRSAAVKVTFTPKRYFYGVGGSLLSLLGQFVIPFVSARISDVWARRPFRAPPCRHAR